MGTLKTHAIAPERVSMLGGEDMDKKLAGLLGAVATLGAMHAAQAAASPTAVLQANSFAELLEPIPNAAAQLRALDEHQASQPAEAKVELAQYYAPYYHH